VNLANESITFNAETTSPMGTTLSFIKRITTLNTFWQRVVHQRIGRDANVNPHRIIIAFQNIKSPLSQDKECENVVMVFPSIKVPNVKNGCGNGIIDTFLNNSNFYKETIILLRDNYKVFNMDNDTFDD
jgi:hypothetical protein